MKKIVLRGELGKKFGRVHVFELNTPAEAIRALTANYEGFEQELCSSGEHGIGYMVHVGKDAMEELDHIHNPTGAMEEISITPVLQGAGGGVGKVFAGIGLIAAAVLLGPAGAGFLGLGAGFVSGATAAAASSIVGYIGVSLVLSGTAQLLSPTISDNPGTFGTTSPTRQRARDSFTPENNEIADNRSSYIFNGAVNLTAQGNPVPLCYGRMRVGSVVVSAGLSTEDI